MNANFAFGTLGVYVQTSDAGDTDVCGVSVKSGVVILRFRPSLVAIGEEAVHVLVMEGSADEYWSSGSEDEGHGDDAGAGGGAGVAVASEDAVIVWCTQRIKELSAAWRLHQTDKPSDIMQIWELPARTSLRRRPSTKKSPDDHASIHTARHRACAVKMLGLIEAAGVPAEHSIAWTACMHPPMEGIKIMLPIMIAEDVFVQLSGCGHSENQAWDTPEYDKLRNFQNCAAESVISALQMKGAPVNTIDGLAALKSEGGLLAQGPNAGMLLSRAVEIGCRHAGVSFTEMNPESLHFHHFMNNPETYILGMDCTDKDGKRRHCVSIQSFSQAQREEAFMESRGKCRLAELRDGDLVRFYDKRETEDQEDVNEWLTGGAVWKLTASQDFIGLK